MMRHTNIAEPDIAIIDFGLAQASVGKGLAGGTPGYRPPETNASNRWYPKGDIFSLGVMFFQLLANKVPDEESGQLGIFQEGATCIEDCMRFVAQRPVPMHLIQKFPGTHSWLPQMMEKDRKKRRVAIQMLALSWFQKDEEQEEQPPSDPQDAADALGWAWPRGGTRAYLSTADIPEIATNAKSLWKGDAPPPSRKDVPSPRQLKDSVVAKEENSAAETAPKEECRPEKPIVVPATAPAAPAYAKKSAQASLEDIRRRVDVRYRNSRAAFLAFDKKKEKVLTRQSFVDGLTMLGIVFPPDTLSEVFSIFDRSGNGEITLAGFVAAMG